MTGLFGKTNPKKKQTALFSSVQAEEHYKETSGYSANEVEHWIKAADFVK